MSQEIMNFQIDQKKYIISLDHNNISISIQENGILRNNLTDEEKNFAYSIYNFIVGSKEDYLTLSKTKYKNFEFTTLVNRKNGLYSFQGSKNTKEELTAGMELSYIFNNQSYILNENFSDEDEHFLADLLRKSQILLKVGGIILTVALTLKTSLWTLPYIPQNYMEFKVDYQIDRIRLASYTQRQDYDFKEIEKIIEENRQLTKDEKEFCKKLKTELEENSDYINFDNVKKDLSDLKINYLSDKQASNVAGKYHVLGDKKHQIDMFKTPSFATKNLETSDKSVLVHELNHALDDYGWLASITDSEVTVTGNNELLCELFNELFSKEYLSTFTDESYTEGYNIAMPIVYVLSEILDDETIRNFKFKTDPYYITHYLESLGVPLEHIYDFYKSLKQINIYLNQKNYEDLIRLANHIYNLLDEFYTAKFGYSITSDLVPSLYLYCSIYKTKEIEEIVENNLGAEIWHIEQKGYVAKNYKSTHESVKIYMANGDVYLINDENRLLIDNKNRKNDKL